METQANTIWTKAYTPAGFQVGITIGFEAGHLPQAVDIDRLLHEAGYLITLPGVEPGETLETITHVVRRTQHNQDGSQTPCIGMYYENPKLVYAKKAYLNTPDEIAAFEQLSGLRIADLPEFPSTALPKRDEKSAQQYIVAAKTPFQIRMADDTYTDESTGEVKPTKKYAGFYTIGTQPTATTGNGTPSNVTSLPAQSNASGNGDEDSSDAWLPKIYSLTEFLYGGIKQHQENSINKLIRERSISSDMKPIVAAAIVFAHKAYETLRLSQDDITDQLGKSLGDYLRSGKTLKNAWDDIQPQVDALPPTGTDDIPF